MNTRKERRYNQEQWAKHCWVIVAEEQHKAAQAKKQFKKVLEIRLPIQIIWPWQNRLSRTIASAKAALAGRQIVHRSSLSVADILDKCLLKSGAFAGPFLMQPSGCTLPVSDLIPVDPHSLPIKCDMAALTTCKDIKGEVHTEVLALTLLPHEARLRFYLFAPCNSH